MLFFFFFKQKTAYEMRISDWSSDVCSSDLMKPALEVGGDFYDYFRIDDDRVGIVIADVSGKGVPASLFMMITRTLLKAAGLAGDGRSEERRVGKECVSPCRSRWSPSYSKKKKQSTLITTLHMTIQSN